MSLYEPAMWVMKITPQEQLGDTKKFFENLFVKEGCKNLIGYTKEYGKIESFKDRWQRMKVGDLIVVLEGPDRAYGVVKITSEPWDVEIFNEDEDWFVHRREARLVKYFNPHIVTANRTNRDTIIEYSGTGAVDICDEIWNLIKDDYKQANLRQSMQEKLDILRYKKQIILQGPPGTGKTRLAKEMAYELGISPSITESDIKRILSVGLKIKSSTDYTEYTITTIDSVGVTVSLAKSPKQYKPTFREIIAAYGKKLWEGGQTNGNDSYAAAIAKYVYKHLPSYQFKVIQFHPSYSYEDFVRGIIAEAKGERIEYKNVNKILGKFAEEATRNWIDSTKDSGNISKENKVQEYFEQFVDGLSEKLTNGEIIKLTQSVKLVDTEEDAFRYRGDDGWTALGNRMLFRDIIQAFVDGNKVRQDIKKNKNLSGLAIQHASYFVRVLNMFQDYLTSNQLNFEQLSPQKVELKNYVLIIDEINRANLSSVLGELIYALEYRGEQVESMYEVDGKSELVLPPNLYIIGTMNTADRSVGHIDYAIRRRFAFVDVLPKDLSTELGDKFHKPLFDAVAALFDTSKSLSPEFDPKDVQLGHSYFIDKSDEGGSMAVRLEYEIKPILREYVKDGILIGEGIEKAIEALTF